MDSELKEQNLSKITVFSWLAWLENQRYSDDSHWWWDTKFDGGLEQATLMTITYVYSEYNGGEHKYENKRKN